MNEPLQCRDINKLNGVVKELLIMALDEIRRCGVTPLVVETLRTKERQYWLYGQGRTAFQLLKKGVPVKYAHKGHIVTQTLNSIHLSGCAVDVVPMRNGKAVWDANDKDTKKIVAIMNLYGFEAGANWTNFKDSPHFQIKLPSPQYNSVSQNNTTPYLTKVIQRALGFSGKDIDGIWGFKTNEAVDKFRASIGLGGGITLYTDNLRYLFK